MRSFVSATMIEQRLCSPSRDGQELLPRLVGKLITGSVPREMIRAFRFPADDQIYLPGEDGILAVDDASQPPQVPGGISVWEMGTSKDPRSKADEDFAKAERKLANAFPDIVPAVTPDKATFVFVTSKPWESGEWVRQKRAVSTWKSIKVIDAVDLEKWIEQCPAVMLWFATICNLPAEGLYDAEQYLRWLGVGFGIAALSPELVIGGRDENVDQLGRLVAESTTDTYIRGESVEEAALFLASASIKAPDSYRNTPPLVFANSRADLNLLATCGAEFTLVPLDSETLARFRHTMGRNRRAIIPEVRPSGASRSAGAGITLGRCKRAAMERYVTEQMKIPEHRAGQMARESKGSLISLLWLLSSGPVGAPRWATRKDATTHASLILAGSWIGDNESDTQIVERLSRNSYRDIETLLQSAQVPQGPWIHWGVEWVCVSRDFVWSQLGDKITETMLSDFHKIVCEVIGEKDPSLELEPSKRHMAAVLGKTREYSTSLRGGLVDSLARLAVLRSDGQGWANRIVRDLLDPQRAGAIDRWLSTADVYSEIAEAAPDIFLECLDTMIRIQDAKAFFQDATSNNAIFNPTSTHVYLLWALERLGWQRQYFSRVLNMLARLAEIDPGTKTSNTPKNSLIAILLPWKPQHTETMQNAVQAVRMLHSVCPKVTWDVAVALLPSSHSSTSPTPTPSYREYAGERQVTWGEYWEFIRAVVELMIEWAANDMDRWASLIEKYPDVRLGYPEAGQLITDALSRVDIGELTEKQKAMVHDSLRELVTRHRQHLDAKWALPTSDLGLLQSLQERFKPRDAVLQCVHLFSWDPDIPDAPMEPYDDGWDEWLAGRQAEAAKTVYDQQGLGGIYRLAEMAHVPECVGQGAATLSFQEAEITELMQKRLSASPSDRPGSPLIRAIKAYMWAKYRGEGEAWLDRALMWQGIVWTHEAYANLALSVPPSLELWKRIEGWGEEADKLYWSNVEIRGKLREYWPKVVAKWKIVGRAWSALELVASVIDNRGSAKTTTKPEVEDVIGILGDALEAGDNVESQRREGGMLRYHVERLFLFLDSQDVVPERLARLEWGWFKVLENTKRGTVALQRQVTSSPELFVDLLRFVFRAEGEPEGKEASEDQRRLAGHAYDVLQAIEAIPGCKSGSDCSEVDPSVLHDWVVQARAIAQSVGRLGVCDSRIGQILSYAPPSQDGSWPCVEVRDLIEEIQSTRLERAIVIGKCNQRGAVVRDTGGKQEWDLANKYRRLAEMVRHRWPRTASVLDDLAKHYESEAQRWDEEAKRDEYE